jgi:hypothetical protein
MVRHVQLLQDVATRHGLAHHSRSARSVGLRQQLKFLDFWFTNTGMASRWKPGWDDLGLILLTLTGMALVCANEFIHVDDPSYVFNNPMVKGGLSIRGI